MKNYLFYFILSIILNNCEESSQIGLDWYSGNLNQASKTLNNDQLIMLDFYTKW